MVAACWFRNDFCNSLIFVSRVIKKQKGTKKPVRYSGFCQVVGSRPLFPFFLFPEIFQIPTTSAFCWIRLYDVGLEFLNLSYNHGDMRFCLPWKNNNKCQWSMDILPRLVVTFTIFVGWCTIEFHKASTDSRLSLIVICFFDAILFSLYKLCILVAWQIEQPTIFAKSIACYIGLA